MSMASVARRAHGGCWCRSTSGAGSELYRHEAAKDTRAQLLLRDAGVADLGRQLRLERGPGRDPPCDLGFIELSGL